MQSIRLNNALIDTVAKSESTGQSTTKASAFLELHPWVAKPGFSCSYSCSVDDGARARFRSFEYDNEHHFIEHEHDFLSRSSKCATSKLTLRV